MNCENIKEEDVGEEVKFKFEKDAFKDKQLHCDICNIKMKKIKISIDIPNTNLKNNLEAYKCPKCNIAYLNGEQAKKFDITIDVETVKGKKIYVAHCLNLDIASQGYSYEEAEKNIKEAIELYLEAYPDALKTSKKKVSLL